MPIEVLRFGVGHRRPDGPPGTTGLAGRVIHSDARGAVAELAFARGARIEPHSNPNTSYFIVIEGGGWTAVGDERIVHEGDIVTCAGVSAGIDLGLWLAGQIGGEGRAKVIQLSMEYDPQPPFDSGHMSKASATTKAAATALMTKDLIKPTQLKATTLLLWDAAIQRARGGRKRRRQRDRQAISAR